MNLMTDVDVPPVNVLITKVSRQASRIGDLERQVSELRKQLEEHELERSREEIAAEAVLRELEKAPEESALWSSFLSGRESGKHESDQEKGEEEGSKENDEEVANNNNNDQSVLTIYHPQQGSTLTMTCRCHESIHKHTVSSTEHKYQLLVNRFNAQCKQVETLKAELEHVKRAKRRTSWSKWEAEFAADRIRKLEEYVRVLEVSREDRDNANNKEASEPDAAQSVIGLELERSRSEARELRQAMGDARRELSVLRARSLKAETVLRDIASAAQIDVPAGKEDVLVVAMKDAQKRASYAQNLALKARTLLNVSLEERDRLESIFRTARGDGKVSVRERSSLVVHAMETKHSTLGRSYPELAEHLKATQHELGKLGDLVTCLEKEQKKCKRIIQNAIDRSSDLLAIPADRRTQFETVADGASLLAKLTISQLEMASPQKQQ